MDYLKINISKKKSGICENCGIKSDEMYAVTLSQNERSKDFSLCRSCAIAMKRNVTKRNQSIATTKNPIENKNVKTSYSIQDDSNKARTVSQSIIDKSKLIKIITVILIIVAVIIVATVNNISNQKGEKESRLTENVYENESSNNHKAISSSDNKVIAKSESTLSNPKGIITLTLRVNGTIDIHCINPDTGASYLVSSFDTHYNNHFPSVHSSYILYSATQQKDFSSNYTKIAFKLTDPESGHIYPYFAENNGKITNVYTSVFGMPDDFNSKITCEVYGFDKNDRYYFDVKQGDNKRYYRVSSQELNKNSLEDLTDVITNSKTYNFNYGSGWKELDMYNIMLFNESDHVIFTSSWNANNKQNEIVNEIYSTDSPPSISSWLDDTHYFINSIEEYGLEYGMYYVSLDTAKRNEERILEVDGRNSIDAIVSPDKSKIAFISWLNSETKAELFISGLKGENPRKVNTDITFSRYDTKRIGFPVGYNKIGWGSDITYILAWI